MNDSREDIKNIDVFAWHMDRASFRIGVAAIKPVRLNRPVVGVSTWMDWLST